ncbi:response regulator [Novosphingobium bradum]|uniref:Response regulator n=1 Tax=Novosphingobium bradum TaxID=1737444 RepID=A0ABV7IX16_9SPHN
MTTVLIADDHPFIRTGVQAVLAPTAFRIVAAVGSGAEALEAVKAHDPDICIFDVTMPAPDGVETLKAMREAGDQRPVVLLTAHIDDRRLAEAIAAGVNGVVGKDGAEDVLVESLERVLAGEQVIAPELVARARAQAERHHAPSPFAALTPRERTIVALAMRGTRNRDIAARLGITEGTVKVYLHALYQKLGVDNRTELAVLALRHPEEFA